MKELIKKSETPPKETIVEPTFITGDMITEINNNNTDPEIKHGKFDFKTGTFIFD